MYQKLTSIIIKQEKFFFLAILLINISFIFNAKFFPSMDGPAHLHNSYLLKQLIIGNDFIDQYYTINTILIPNWVNHFILSFLLCLTDGNIAEKGTHIIYLLVFSFSFRYYVKQIQAHNIFGAVIIFPFLFSFLLHLGFLNFCYSIAFMFMGMGYFIKHHRQLNIKNKIILFLILFLVYFSNVLGFLYLLFFLFSFSLIYSINESSAINKDFLVKVARNYFQLFIVSFIPIICLMSFYKQVTFFPSENSYQKVELLDWIYSLRALIVYNVNDDKKYTQFLFAVLLMSFAVAAFNYFQKEQKIKLTIHLVLLIVLFLTVIALMKIPDGSSAGMMSDRFALMLCFVFLATFMSFPIPRTVLAIIVLCALFSNFSVYYYNHKTTILNYSNHAENIYSLSSKLKSKSIVLPIKMEGDWLEGHFSNYLGVDKDLVILENYEANVGWFPVKWNTENLPKFMLGTKTSIGNIYWTTNWKSKINKKIDYVLIYGNTSKLDQPEYAELKQELSNSYIMDESITDSYTKLFKIK